MSTEKHKNEQRDAVDNCISPFSRDMPKYYGEESEMEINSVWHQHESSQSSHRQFESISSKSLPFKKPEDRNGKISIGAREQPHTREESELEIKNSECFQNRSSRSSHDQRMSSKSLLPKYKDIQHTHVISAHKTEGSWTDPQNQNYSTIQRWQVYTFTREKLNNTDHYENVSLTGRLLLSLIHTLLKNVYHNPAC